MRSVLQGQGSDRYAPWQEEFPSVSRLPEFARASFGQFVIIPAEGSKGIQPIPFPGEHYRVAIGSDEGGQYLWLGARGLGAYVLPRELTECRWAGRGSEASRSVR